MAGHNHGIRYLLTLLIIGMVLVGSVAGFAQPLSAQAQEPPPVSIIFNPTGTHITNEGLLKVRLDIYFGEGSQTYNRQYVDKSSTPYQPSPQELLAGTIDPLRYQVWWDTTPKHPELNPALIAFVSIDEKTSVADLISFISSKLSDNNLATIDNALTQPDAKHLIPSFMADKSVIKFSDYSKYNVSQQATLIANMNSRFGDFSYNTMGGIPSNIIPESITAGTILPSPSSFLASGYTILQKTNPVSGDGTITQIRIYLDGASATTAGTFYLVSGTTYKTRGSESCGTVTGGSLQTVVGLTITSIIGDLIGNYRAANNLYRSTITGGQGIYYRSGDCTAPDYSGAYTDYIPGEAVIFDATGTESGGLEITNTPDSKDWGTVNLGATSNTEMSYFTITNIGSGAVDVSIQGSDFTGGDDTWDLSDNATNGDNIYGLKAGLDDADDNFDIIVKEIEAVTLITNLSESDNQSWGLWILMPSSVTGYDNQQMTATITLVASAYE